MQIEHNAKYDKRKTIIIVGVHMNVVVYIKRLHVYKEI